MKAVVLLSGGLDSTVALAMEKAIDEPVECLTVDYGQRHRREIQAAADIADHYGIPHTIVKVDPILFSGSALTFGTDVPDGAATEPDATYVPARNTVLIALATARAEVIGARKVVIGANKDDAAAYPDCRPQYIEAYRDVLMEGTVGHVWLSAPLIGRHKDWVVQAAKEMFVPVHLTYSCYRGDAEPCGRCGACIGRGDAA